MRKYKSVKQVIILVMILSMTILLVGCQNEANSTINDTTDITGDIAETTTDTAPETIPATTSQEVTYAELEVGDAAPDFAVELLSGETVKLADYRGKVVLLNFWATWCGPCVSEMQDIQKISEAFSEEAIVLAVNCSEKRDTVSSFIEDKGYTFNIGLDENMEIQEKYPTDGIPYTIIIDGEGIITEIHLGSSDDMFSVFEEDIKAAGGEK